MNKLLVEHVFETTLEYLDQMPRMKRKEIGQFFTSVETARFMASMFAVPSKSSLSILDPGSGSGILTAAVIEKLQNSCVKRINVTCYETCKDIQLLLRTNLQFIKEHSSVDVEFEVLEENYITSQNCAEEDSRSINKYDWIICNPPYKKIPKDAPEALSMQTVCHGAPNLYFLFTAMGLKNLNRSGEMVYIIPRSWTSGAYFKKFREFLLNNACLCQIHLFVSRDRVFEEEKVLQETIIIKVNKEPQKDNIRITTSYSNSDFNQINVYDAPSDVVILGSEKYICLVANDEELRIIRTISRWRNTLLSINCKMRTGLTVDYRSKAYLRSQKAEDVVPLFYPQHIKNGQVIFPCNKENEYITTEKEGLTQENKNYLFIKRFTSKEEKRRLQGSIYLREKFPQYERISTQNKINFIEGVGFDLSVEQVYGLYVLLNSTIYDKYYRLLDGSTQVNSTEMNTMPIPSMEEIIMLGKKLLSDGDLSVEKCDEILGVLINE